MPTPNQLQVVDPILTNISIQYKNLGFVADRIFPRVPVAEVSGTYYIYNKANFDVVDTRRAARSGFNRVGWSVSTDTYKCFENGLEDIIDDRERKIAKSPLNLDIDTTEYITSMIMLAAEKRVVDIVTSESNITQYTTKSGTSQWNDAGNSDPIADIETGKDAINAATGLDPNILVISREVYSKLSQHPALLDRIKYSQKGVVTADLMAAIFGVDEVLVAHALYNSAKKGQDVSLLRLWGKHALLCYSKPSLTLKNVSLGYTIEFTARQTMAPFRDKDNIGDVIRVKEDVDEKLVAAPCGYFIKNAVA